MEHSNTQTLEMTIQELHNHEWLSIICSRLRLNPLRAALLMGFVNLVIDVPLALRFDVLFSTDQTPRGLFGEPADWLYEFLIHPIIFAYFVWMQTSGRDLFAKLAGKEVVSSTRLEKEVRKLHQRLLSNWAWIIGAVASLVFVFWFTLAFAPDLSISPFPDAPYAGWITKNPMIAFVRAPVIFIVFYALVIVIYDLVYFIAALNTSFKDEEVRIEPMNPDKAGGLSFIGRFSANLSYLIAASGILLLTRIQLYLVDSSNFANLFDLSNPRNYVFLFGIAAYLVLSPVLFIIPLWTAHQAMVRYRESLLRSLSKRFNVLMTKLRDSLWQSEPQDEELLELIRQQSETRDLIVKEVPVWPFNTSSLQKFLSISLSPLAGAIISLIIDMLPI